MLAGCCGNLLRFVAIVWAILVAQTLLPLVAVPAHFRSFRPTNIADCHSRSEKLVICSMSDLAAAAAAAGCSEAAAAMAAAATAPGRDAMQCDGVTGKLGAQITF